MIALTAALVLVGGLMAGCGSDDGTSEVTVVATTTIIGDIASNVVGDAATVEVLLPLGANPHEYVASSSQVASIVGADLVLANGLDLEAGLHDVLESSEADGATVVHLGESLDPIPFVSVFDHDEDTHDYDDEAHEEEAGHDHDEDPHIWLDPLRMADAALLIAAELEAIAPGDGWIERADAYAAELRATDSEIIALLDAIPESDRVLVTGHNSLGYFADRYGFELVGTVIPGGSTLAEPSSAEMAELVHVIEEAGVQAIFTDSFEPSALADAVAAEVGYPVAVVPLYTGSLGEEGSGAETLIDLLLSNARRIAEALT